MITINNPSTYLTGIEIVISNCIRQAWFIYGRYILKYEVNKIFRVRCSDEISKMFQTLNKTRYKQHSITAKGKKPDDPSVPYPEQKVDDQKKFRKCLSYILHSKIWGRNISLQHKIFKELLREHCSDVDWLTIKVNIKIVLGILKLLLKG